MRKLWTDLAWKFPEFLVIAFLTFLVTLILWNSPTNPPLPSTTKPTTSQEPTSIPSVIKYSPATCFVLTLNTLPPHTEADGVVVLVGDGYYIVMWHGEADRKSGGDKYGQRVEMTLLDSTTEPVACPSSWMQGQFIKPLIN